MYIHTYIPTCMGFPGGSDGKESDLNVGNPGLIPGLGKSPGEGNSNPVQYSCLGNPIDRGAWWSSAHGVAKRLTQLSNEHFHFLHIYLQIDLDIHTYTYTQYDYLSSPTWPNMTIISHVATEISLTVSWFLFSASHSLFANLHPMWWFQI